MGEQLSEVRTRLQPRSRTRCQALSYAHRASSEAKPLASKSMWMHRALPRTSAAARNGCGEVWALNSLQDPIVKLRSLPAMARSNQSAWWKDSWRCCWGFIENTIHSLEQPAPLLRTATPSHQRLTWFPPSYPSRGGVLASLEVFDERECSFSSVTRWAEDASDIETRLIRGHGDCPRIHSTNLLKPTISLDGSAERPSSRNSSADPVHPLNGDTASTIPAFDEDRASFGSDRQPAEAIRLQLSDVSQRLLCSKRALCKFINQPFTCVPRAKPERSKLSPHMQFPSWASRVETRCSALVQSRPLLLGDHHDWLKCSNASKSPVDNSTSTHPPEMCTARPQGANDQTHASTLVDHYAESIILSLPRSIEDVRATHLGVLHRAIPGIPLNCVLEGVSFPAAPQQPREDSVGMRKSLTMFDRKPKFGQYGP
ncbi:hypothetical protein BKA70DRAFT_1221428 [Coprinopsis sp. MPI-PUGE-AT-0042]|nr:hypothetical protein BKA70DRAFT_1221428 [Coprinopsis sp. MPI-PUGE-AT-0042]